MKKRTVNLSNSHDPFQHSVMERIVRDEVCPFCGENFLRYHTRPIIKSGKHWILTENFAPYKGSKHHLLAVSKKHTTHFMDLSTAAQSELFTLFADEVRRRGIKGGAILMRFGNTDYTTGTVEHLHAQLISGVKRGGKDSKPILTGVGFMKKEKATAPERSPRPRS